MSQYRVRFAPSPTGYLHVGNARTAILNWLFARNKGGRMVLRVEDTDVARSTRELEKALIEDLHWLGLNWDEGPDVGGEYGPYRQSERLGIYKEYAHQLLSNGYAFHCYCTNEELKSRAKAAMARGEGPHYDGHCLNLTDEQIKQYQKEGREPAIRFHVPNGTTRFSDLLRGYVDVSNSTISDFVILRSEGFATYNFAVVVDDALMKISHVIRGEDHLSNTPKQALLFRALNYDLPTFVHIPMIMGKDRAKLSKRHGDNQVRDYRNKGYLPEAMINFLSLLGWSSPSGDELLPVDRLVQEFSFERLSKGAAIFDMEKLNWMNGWYLRHLDTDQLLELSLPFLKAEGFDVSDHSYVTQCIQAVIDRVEYLAQLPDKCRYFFQDSISYENEEIVQSENSQTIYRHFLHEMDEISNWNKDVFFQIMKTVQKSTGMKGRNLWMPIRLALTGKEHGPELPVIVERLGFEKCKKFIKMALQK